MDPIFDVRSRIEKSWEAYPESYLCPFGSYLGRTSGHRADVVWLMRASCRQKTLPLLNHVLTSQQREDGPTTLTNECWCGSEKKKKKKSNGTRPHTVGPIKDQGSSAAPFLGCKNARWGPPQVFVCLELVQTFHLFLKNHGSVTLFLAFILVWFWLRNVTWKHNPIMMIS